MKLKKYYGKDQRSCSAGGICTEQFWVFREGFFVFFSSGVVFVLLRTCCSNYIGICMQQTNRNLFTGRITVIGNSTPTTVSRDCQKLCCCSGDLVVNNVWKICDVSQGQRKRQGKGTGEREG